MSAPTPKKSSAGGGHNSDSPHAPTNDLAAVAASHARSLLGADKVKSEGELVAVAVTNGVVADALALYLGRHYDTRAVEYTALALWDEMMDCVSCGLIHEDRGIDHLSPLSPSSPGANVGAPPPGSGFSRSASLMDDGRDAATAAPAAPPQLATGGSLGAVAAPSRLRRVTSVDNPPIAGAGAAAALAAPRRATVTRTNAPPIRPQAGTAPRGRRNSSGGNPLSTARTPNSQSLSPGATASGSLSPGGAKASSVGELHLDPSSVGSAGLPGGLAGAALLQKWSPDSPPRGVPSDEDARRAIVVRGGGPLGLQQHQQAQTTLGHSGTEGRYRRSRVDITVGSNDGAQQGTFAARRPESGGSASTPASMTVNSQRRASLAAALLNRTSVSQPAAKGTAAAKGDGGASAGTAPPAAAPPTEAVVSPQPLTAEEQAHVDEIAAKKAHAASLLATQQSITRQLADAKFNVANGARVVVDSISGKVIPVLAGDGVAAGARAAEAVKFNVVAPPAPTLPPPEGTTKAKRTVAGGRGGGPNTAVAPVGRSGAGTAAPRGKDDQFFVAEGTQVQLVLPQTTLPGGGVAIKEMDGPQRRNDFKVPGGAQAVKLSRADFKRLAQQTNLSSGGTAADTPEVGDANAAQGPAVGVPARVLSKAAKAPPTTKGSEKANDTAAAGGGGDGGKRKSEGGAPRAADAPAKPQAPAVLPVTPRPPASARGLPRPAHTKPVSAPMSARHDPAKAAAGVLAHDLVLLHKAGRPAVKVLQNSLLEEDDELLSS